jgi:hypothetical protein
MLNENKKTLLQTLMGCRLHVPIVQRIGERDRLQDTMDFPTKPGFGWVAVSFCALTSAAKGRPMERSKVTMRRPVKLSNIWEGNV